ncbi:MAG TPA: RHS repeat-associated core domain-containing protein, partial [Candidatus Saccharimonadales bacterium]|nr:RHS repeat-associated core domain-containing protein [Candidatus Saccharimonadales bacterium]
IRTLSYDGYGRMKERITPEQGTSTYTYFADDDIQTITDARGATTTFGYNNRGLVNSITYGVPSGVAATPNVSFGYDSAGNRTSMTDGLGSISYVYNTLSRMTSETRTFAGVGAYTLSYDYNLAGQLKSFTNHWNAQVGYVYDKIGRTKNVTGSGYMGVSSYVNSMAYRAFGLKQMAYNNGRTLSLQYDNRMRLTQWNIPNVMGWNYAYQYFGENTGRVTYAQNMNDPTLDRSYHYDHVGRLQSAYTGSSARAHVEIGSNWLSDGPYAQQDNVYDVWGNTLSRTGWGGTNPQYGAGYTNNKMNTMVYDAKGNLKDAGGGWTFTYDATGQQATSAVGNVQMFYDGDRLRGKKNENGVITYYLRSSVLGGQVVAELTSAGAWSRGYVYLGGQVMAVQQAGVYWMHQDPVAKSKRVTNASGNVVSTIELDPWGGETNRSSNEAFQPRKFTTYERDSIGSDDAMHRRYNRWWSRFEQPDPYDGSYDLSDPQSFNRYSYVQNDPVNFVDPLGLDGLGALGDAIGRALGPIGPGTVTVTVPINGGSNDLVVEFGSEFSTTGGGAPDTRVTTIDPDGIRSALDQMLQTGGCGQFIEELINRLAADTKNPFVSDYAPDLFDSVRNAKKGGFIRGGLADKNKVSATVSGQIRSGNAAIYLNSNFDGSFDAQAEAKAIIAVDTFNTLHELVHHAGSKGYYSDIQIAQTLSKWLGVPGLPVRKKGESRQDFIYRNSSYFSGVLREKCPVLSGNK